MMPNHAWQGEDHRPRKVRTRRFIDPLKEDPTKKTEKEGKKISTFTPTDLDQDQVADDIGERSQPSALYSLRCSSGDSDQPAATGRPEAPHSSPRSVRGTAGLE